MVMRAFLGVALVNRPRVQTYNEVALEVKKPTSRNSSLDADSRAIFSSSCWYACDRSLVPASALDQRALWRRTTKALSRSKTARAVGASIEQVLEDELFYLGRVDVRLIACDQPGLVGHENGALIERRQPAVRTFDQARVERDHVEQHAKAEGFLRQLLPIFNAGNAMRGSTNSSAGS